MSVRPRTATVLSLTGVLLAGAAATAINAGVLRGPAPLALAEPAASAPTDSAGPDPAADLANPVAVYRIGDAGSVTVRTHNGGIEVTSVSPSPGWSDGPVSQATAQSVTVDLLSPAQGVRFMARLVGGIVTTSVESLPGTSPTAATTPDTAPPVSAPSTSNPDDTGDDHHDSGSHHDDHNGSDDHHSDDHHGYEDGDD